ncbi:MAG TPA: Hsp70 family protein, partial [Acidimicrobiales bacterium]
MSYTLGVDLGTSATTAAVLRDGRIEPCPLAESSPAVPSIVLPRDDGRTLIGEPAAMHGGVAAVRLARSGDQAGVGTPGRLDPEVDPEAVALGAEPGAGGDDAGKAEAGRVDVREAVGLLLDAVVDQATAEAGAKPGRVAVACPPAHVGASTGPYAWLAEDTTDEVVLVDAAVAVAALVDHERGLPVGSTIGVLDLGGDVCDAALVRRTDGGFARVGRPFCGPGLGGWEVDTIVLEHVDAALDHAASSQGGAPADEPAGGLDRLRTGCRRAREQLLRAEETVIEVGLPRLTARVRLTRAELERLLLPRLGEAVATLEQAVADAGLSAADLAGVVLVGGAARLPAAVALAAARLRRPVLVGSSPELTTALGAALVGAPATFPDGAPVPVAATTAGAGLGGTASAAGPDGAHAPRAGAGAAGAMAAAGAAARLAGHQFRFVEGDPPPGSADGARPAAPAADGRGRRVLGRHRRPLAAGGAGPAPAADGTALDPDPLDLCAPTTTDDDLPADATSDLAADPPAPDTPRRRRRPRPGRPAAQTDAATVTATGSDSAGAAGAPTAVHRLDAAEAAGGAGGGWDGRG